MSNNTDNKTVMHEATSKERALRLGNLWQTIGYLIILSIIVLSLIPNPEEVTPFQVSDKIQHALAYAVAMFWFGLCFRRKRLYITGITLLILGIILEVIQGQTGYREMSLYDIFANITGILIGLLLSFSRLSLALQYIEKLIFR